MNILVVAPHMDDEVLGVGGTIAKHKASGDRVWVIFAANRVYNHQYDEEKNLLEKTHAMEAKSILGYDEAVFLNLNDERLDVAVQDILIPLEEHITEIIPEAIYVPFYGDNHQDHRAVFDAVRVAVRPLAADFIKGIYMYDVPSSTEQSPPLPSSAFLPNHYVNTTDFIDKKIAALLCYQTEKRVYPHPRSPEAVRVLAQKRGIEVGFGLAEGFMILRSKWK